MAEQQQEYAFGRRHLANMMGKDPENFTPKDINVSKGFNILIYVSILALSVRSLELFFLQEAIRYLFPSGLYEPKARPMMKPPEEIYPKQKAAQFDGNGRPHHPFFYTTKQQFYYLLFVSRGFSL